MRNIGVLMEQRYYTVDEIAQLLGFHRATVLKWIKDGELVASRIRREYRVRESDLDDFMSRRQIKPKKEEQ